MGKKIDWEAIEADYRAGYISVNQLAKNHNITEGAIRKKAQRGNWPRDLSEKIRAAADRKLLIEQQREVREAENASTVRTNLSESDESTIVDRAATLQADVVMRHRKKFDDLNAMADSLDAKFTSAMEDAMDNRDIAMAANTLKSIVETRAKIVFMERQNHKIDENVSGGGVEDFLRKIRNV